MLVCYYYFDLQNFHCFKGNVDILAFRTVFALPTEQRILIVINTYKNNISEIIKN